MDDEHRKPLPREAFLMRLLHFKSLDELQKWMSEPTSPQFKGGLPPEELDD